MPPLGSQNINYYTSLRCNIMPLLDMPIPILNSAVARLRRDLFQCLQNKPLQSLINYKVAKRSKQLNMLGLANNLRKRIKASKYKKIDISR